MLESAEAYQTEEAIQNKELSKWEKKQRLTTLFQEIDTNNDGLINDQEFIDLMRDPGLRQELEEASGLHVRELQDLFRYLSTRQKNGTQVIASDDFITKVQMEETMARERTLFRLEYQLTLFERGLDKKITTVQEKLQQQCCGNH